MPPLFHSLSVPLSSLFLSLSPSLCPLSCRGLNPGPRHTRQVLSAEIPLLKPLSQGPSQTLWAGVRVGLSASLSAIPASGQVHLLLECSAGHIGPWPPFAGLSNEQAEHCLWVISSPFCSAVSEHCSGDSVKGIGPGRNGFCGPEIIQWAGCLPYRSWFDPQHCIAPLSPARSDPCCPLKNNPKKKVFLGVGEEVLQVDFGPDW